MTFMLHELCYSTHALAQSLHLKIKIKYIALSKVVHVGIQVVHSLYNLAHVTNFYHVMSSSLFELNGCLMLRKFAMVVNIVSTRNLLASRASTQLALGDHGTPDAHNRWFILFYRVRGPAWIGIHWNSIWLIARSHMTSHYTWGSVTTTTWFWRCVGTAFGHFLLGSHNVMVMDSWLLAHVWSAP